MAMTDDGFSFSRPQSSAGLVRSSCYGGSNDESRETTEAITAEAARRRLSSDAPQLSASPLN